MTQQPPARRGDAGTNMQAWAEERTHTSAWESQQLTGKGMSLRLFFGKGQCPRPPWVVSEQSLSRAHGRETPSSPDLVGSHVQEASSRNSDSSQSRGWPRASQEGCSKSGIISISAGSDCEINSNPQARAHSHGSNPLLLSWIPALLPISPLGNLAPQSSHRPHDTWI